MADKQQQLAINGLTNRGNKAVEVGALAEAVKCYTEVLVLDPENALALSNRSVAYTRMGRFNEALEDAENLVKIKPGWWKSYLRKAVALTLLERHEEAMMACMEGINYDPKNPQLKAVFTEARMKIPGGRRDMPLVNVFGDSRLFEKLEANPQTRNYLLDAEYRKIIQHLQTNPNDLGLYLEDARIMASVGVVMGVDLSLPTSDVDVDPTFLPQSNEPPPGQLRTGPIITELPDDTLVPSGPTITEITNEDEAKTTLSKSAKRRARKKAQQAGKTSTDHEETASKSLESKEKQNEQSKPKSGNETENQSSPSGKDSSTLSTHESPHQALEEKEKGNEAYKKKKFEEALEHYNKAIELDPTNIIYRNNRAAVYFEQKEYDKCIKECEEAVEAGRENRAHFQLIAKAFARIGTAYSKKEDLEKALFYYNKSLSEHRDQNVVKKCKELEKLVKEQQRLAYIDPEKALLEKQRGNEFFQKGQYPEAIKAYTEAIRRNPKDAKLYSNRAACYTKLAEFPTALKDTEECIKLDPTFVKGYLRQGGILMGMKNMTSAQRAYQKALELDPNCQEAMDGYRKCVVQENDPEVVKQRAMSDPEIQKILADPAMQLILSQMQKDPKALQEHLKNPDVASKIQKLMECGLIGIR